MKQKPQKYEKGFYELLNQTTQSSAKEIVGYLCKLIKPESVVDLGCGIGIWLKEFERQNIKDIFGIDGPWLKKESLIISQDKFLHQDLNKKISLNKKFDLAISLEVAEHLSPSSAKELIFSLTQLSDVVFFSAAVPFQGGVNHINEQYQSYWVDIFKENGYVPIDCVRKFFWNEDRILSHYLQNSFIYVKKSKLGDYSHLIKEEKDLKLPLNIIHPREYERYAKFGFRVKRVIPQRVIGLSKKLFS